MPRTPAPRPLSRHLRLGSARLLAGLLCLAFGLSAQAQNLVLWTMQLAPFHNDYVLGVIQRFEAANPGVRVKWVDVPWSEMERKVLTSIAAGTAPDVVNLNPQFSAKLAEHGALVEPERYLSADEVAQYLPSAWRGNQLNGRTFALPWYLTSNITLVNGALLQRAQAQVPQDWPQLLETARRVHEKTGAYAYFAALDGSAPLEMLAATLTAGGGSLFTQDGCQAAFNNAAGREFFDRYRQLYEQRLVPGTVLTEGHRTGVTMFLSGQVAMVSTGLPFLAQVKTANPSLYAQVQVAPQIGLRKNLSVMNLAVPMASRHPALAMKLAQFISNNDNQLALARRVPVLPSTRAGYQDPLFTQASGDALMDRARALSAQQVAVGEVLVPPVRRYSQLRNSFTRNLQATMLGRQDSASALLDISNTWRALLACPAG